MARRKPWQRPGGDVRAVDQAARNTKLAEQLQAALDAKQLLRDQIDRLCKRLDATELQEKWAKDQLKDTETKLEDARMRVTDLELDLAARTAELDKERAHTAGACSHASEARRQKARADELAKQLEQLQRANERRDSRGWAVR